MRKIFLIFLYIMLTHSTINFVERVAPRLEIVVKGYSNKPTEHMIKTSLS